jgi:hypothetical protein
MQDLDFIIYNPCDVDRFLMKILLEFWHLLDNIGRPVIDYNHLHFNSQIYLPVLIPVLLSTFQNHSYLILSDCSLNMPKH